MNCFLMPFVTEMNDLSQNGVEWVDHEGNERITCVFPGPCTVDTVTRDSIMNMTLFNGAYGCRWCQQEGEVIEKESGHSRVYPVLSPKPVTRTDVSFRENATKAEVTKRTQYGTKGPSVLFFMSFFMFPGSFVVDYMHAVCSGFVKYTMCMWFSQKAAFPYSIGGLISSVDGRLSALKPIWEFSRLPRSLETRKYWKACEWRNCLLFFSSVVLCNFLPPIYYRNWLKFVKLMHFLFAQSVPLEKLRKVRKEMVLF